MVARDVKGPYGEAPGPPSNPKVSHSDDPDGQRTIPEKTIDKKRPTENVESPPGKFTCVPTVQMHDDKDILPEPPGLHSHHVPTPSSSSVEPTVPLSDEALAAKRVQFILDARERELFKRGM